MCDGRTGPASQGYEARDAADFAAAGVDMLKVDSCGGGEAVDKYGKYVDTEEPLVEQGGRQCAYLQSGTESAISSGIVSSKMKCCRLLHP